jgi:class 3 adenylate cyclase/tetratricopeptide (TPR) repeat protein
MEPRGTRKVVTVLFCDVEGFTPLSERLDAESVRLVMTRYFDEMRTVLKRHGGTVEKFIGDAVMAIFGIPLLHEDDALRAVRAAEEMRGALSRINEDLERRWGISIRLRIGINTGEVVVGDPAAGQALVVGDAVNVAARLEQAATPGDVLMGPDTYALVRDHVSADEGESLTLKGKRAPVTAYRLLAVEAGSPAVGWRAEAPLVGRERELSLLRAAFERTASNRGCQMLTIVGSAGVGKSRLAREFVAEIGDEVRVLAARCLPYGEGITFWPVAELVKQACGISDDDSRQGARSKIDTALADVEEAGLIAERVAAVTGLTSAAVAIQETFWAIRRFLERLGSDRPLVAVIDDVQWAEPTFLDLIEYLAGWSREGSSLLLCLARPDLLDGRPNWASGVTNATSLVLEPLSDAESGRLVATLLGGGGRLEESALARITETAGGNPLFLEEMLRMLEDDGLLRRDDGRWRATADLSRVAVPATIQALLSTRLDRLPPDERTVISCAAVVGKEFWWGAVADLAPETLRPRVGGLLQALVRKELIRPERSTLAGEDAFRFRHILIQEAAYRGTPKEIRAELHERFAGWVERSAGERAVEYEEVIGYHLERAYRYPMELGVASEPDAELATRAGAHLASAGRRALGRGDMSAAADLLGRAAALFEPTDRDRLSLLPELGEALMEAGDLASADAVLSEAIARAEAAGDPGLRSHALIVRLLLQESTDPKRRSEEALRELEGLIPVFEELGDELGLARAWRLMGDVHWTRARYADAGDAFRRAVEHAGRAGAVWEEAESLGQFAGAGVYGPTPVPEVVERCREVFEAARGNRLVEARALRGLAALRAMEGRFQEGRELAGRARSMLEDLGFRLRAAFVSEACGFVEMLADDPKAAERELRAGFDVIQELGEQGYLSTAAALLAHALLAQGRLDEAGRLTEVSEGSAAEDDLATQVLWRSARGRVLAARERPEDAERLGREAVALAAQTDDLNMRADALRDLADVLRTIGRREESTSVLAEALELYEAKGNVVSAERAKVELEA